MLTLKKKKKETKKSKGIFMWHEQKLSGQGM